MRRSALFIAGIAIVATAAFGGDGSVHRSARHIPGRYIVVLDTDADADGGGTADCNGHGTHVAGVIGGSNYGVATSATLVPVRVLDCTGMGTISTVLAGLDWVLQDHAQSSGPAVVNMSLGGDASSALDTEVNSLLTAGITTVVAAGNDNID